MQPSDNVRQEVRFSCQQSTISEKSVLRRVHYAEAAPVDDPICNEIGARAYLNPEPSDTVVEEHCASAATLAVISHHEAYGVLRIVVDGLDKRNSGATLRTTVRRLRHVVNSLWNRSEAPVVSADTDEMLSGPRKLGIQGREEVSANARGGWGSGSDQRPGHWTG